jgi:hypothetical protein
MKRALIVMAGVSMLASPAFAQVRPQDCRPMLPLMDDLPPVADVIAEPAVPVAATQRGFFGLPFLMPLLAAGSFFAINPNGSSSDPVSPA